MSVSKHCNYKVVTGTGDQGIAEIARLMREHHIGDVIIVEQGIDCAVPVGILTDRDIALRVVAEGLDAEKVKASDVMSRDLMCVHEDDSLADAIQRMRMRGVKRVPVIGRRGELRGILSLDDVLAHLGEELQAATRVLDREIEYEKILD